MPFHEGFGNPLNVLIHRESKTCKGCIHQSTDKAFGILINFCQKGKKKMVRCSEYQEILNAKAR